MKDLLNAAYERLHDVTPMLHDCGAYCGAACCAAEDNDENGVFLFPGEVELIGPQCWMRLSQVDAPVLGPTPMLICEKSCDRAYRPLGCRIFPLTPYYRKNGHLDVRIDRRAYSVCPLAGHGVKGLAPAFVQTVRAVLTELDSDPEMHHFLTKWIGLEALYARETL